MFGEQFREKLTAAYLRRYAHISGTIEQETTMVLQNDSRIPVWMFWAQGIDHAPELVRVNAEHTKQILNNKKYRVQVLDLKLAINMLDIPEALLTKYRNGKMQDAFFSDLIRVMLLAKYGGLWVDATVYLSMPEIPTDILESPFFIFKDEKFNLKNNDYLIPGSNWLIWAKKGSTIADMMQSSLIDYWLKNDYVPYYFFFHVLMGLIFKQNPADYEGMPSYYNKMPHIVQSRMGHSIDAIELSEVLEFVFAHKLSYKLSFKSDKDEKIFYETLFR